MIDHVSIPVGDLRKSSAFYEATLSEIGFKLMASKEHTVGFGKKYPEFWLNLRKNLTDKNISDGFHVCLRADSIEQINAFYTMALSLGASANGEPGFRKEYSNNYYAAFIMDFDGNRIEVVTFTN